MERVSVILPAYNAERWIAAALRSVFRQTYGNIEIIVVDDGSQDSTSVVAQETLGTFPGGWQLIRQANAGVSAARNAGCRAASGTWVQFLDSDDMLAPDKIATQLGVVSGSGGAEISVIYSCWQRVVGDGDAVAAFEQAQDPNVDNKPPVALLLGKNCIHPGSVLIRRSAMLDSGGFDETMSLYEDTDLLLQLAVGGFGFKHAPSKTPLYLYRMFPGQVRWGGTNARYRLTDVVSVWLDLVKRYSGSSFDGLNREDRLELSNDMTMFLRLIYKHDRSFFRQFLQRVRDLDPTYAPRQPRHLRLLSALLGFEQAERAGDIVRHFRRSFAGHAQNPLVS